MIAPMIYVMMGVSVFIGFAFMTGFLASPAESILYSVGVLVHKQVWGAALFTTASIAEVGFITDNDRLIQLGGLWGFMLWLFACIALAMDGQWYVFIAVGCFHLIFHGYVVLATSLGYIRRPPIS
jgi:predicted membrane channel-forming protein YqfA (hemolysin III family)